MFQSGACISSSETADKGAMKTLVCNMLIPEAKLIKWWSMLIWKWSESIEIDGGSVCDSTFDSTLSVPA